MSERIHWHPWRYTPSQIDQVRERFRRMGYKVRTKKVITKNRVYYKVGFIK